MKYVLQRHRHRIFWVSVGLVGLTLLLIGWRVVFSRSGELATTDEPVVTQGGVVPKQIISRTLSFGDVFWGRYIDEYAKASPSRYTYPFQALDTLSRSDYDAWIANLECPLTDRVMTAAEQDATLQFTCPKEYTAEAAKWFTAFTLANNHTDNQQAIDGFAQTRATLEAHGIQYFGHYDPALHSDMCEVVTLPARMQMSDGTYKVAHLPLAMCGAHHVFKLPTDEDLAVIRRYADVMPTWVYGHMGTEYTTEPSEVQRATYRAYIDAGADMVLGSHPHRVQTAEAYKGKLIVYSLGNFIFDQLGAAEHGGYEVWRGIGIGVTISAAADDTMMQWSQLSPQCRSFQDTCLQTLAAASQPPRYKYAFSIVTTDNSKKGVARKASEQWDSEARRRLNWEVLVGQLSY